MKENHNTQQKPEPYQPGSARRWVFSSVLQSSLDTQGQSLSSDNSGKIIRYIPYLLTVVFFCLLISLPAQQQSPSFLLDEPLSGNHHYQASQYIKLKPGFEYKATAGATFIADINPFLLFPPEEGETGGPNPGDDGVVGALPAVVNITEIGAVSYSIPVKVPPGIGNFIPQLAITYNSMLGNGLLGWGWTISGLSSITRTRATIYHDTLVDGVNFNEYDRFALDGQRLMLISGAYGANDAQYRTEVDIMAKIVSYKQAGHNGPEKFKVWHKDGTIWHYGYSTDSRIEPQGQNNVVLTWLVNRIEDRQGNFITFNYTENNSIGEYYITSIEYSANSRLNQQPYYEIVFSYIDRNDKEFYFVGQSRISTTKLLNEIRIKRKSPSEPLFQYDLSYDEPNYENGDFYTRLNAISFQEKQNNHGVNKTNVVWGEKEPMTNNNLGYNSPVNGVVFPGDFTGNGYTDLLVLPPRPTSGYTSNHKWELFTNDKAGDFTSTGIKGELCNGLLWIYVADFTGDGMDDFLYVKRGGGLFITPFIAKDDGSVGFIQKDIIYYSTPINATEEILVGDFWGEGKSSFIVKRDGSNQVDWSYYVYENDNFVLKQQNAYVSTWGDATYTADFNGDGKTDIMVVDNYNTKIYSLKRNENQNLVLEMYYDNNFPTKWHRIFTGDFNGDGKADLLTWSEGGAWEITFFKETGFQAPSVQIIDLPQTDPGQYANSLSLLHEEHDYIVRVADFNGDGKSDILTLKWVSDFPDFERELKICYSPIKIDGSANVFSKISLHNVNGLLNPRNQNIFMGDFTGNGCVALLGTKNDIMYYNNGWPYLFTFPTIIYNFHPAEMQYTIASITDGFSNSTAFTFEFMTQSSNYSKDQINGTIAGLINSVFPVRVLTQMASNHVSGLPEITTYNYKNAKLHREGKGWLGFETIKTYNNKSNLTVRKDYEVLSGQFVPVLKTDSVFLTQNATPSNLLSASLLVYQKAIGSNAKIIIPQITHHLKHTWEKPGVFLRTELNTFTYDNLVSQPPVVPYYRNNNITNQSKFSDPIKRNNPYNASLFKYRNIQEYEYLTGGYYTNNWLLSLVDNVLSTSSIMGVSGSELTSRAEFGYYPQGHNHHPLPQFKKIVPENNPNDELVTLVEFNYDLAGNPTQSSLSAPNYQPPLPNRTSSIEYSSQYQYRFPTSTTNPMGYTTSNIYNLQYGWLASTTGFNGLATSFTQHPLGISSDSEFPDGTKQMSVLRWANNQPHAPKHHGGALYYSWSQVSGQSEVITFYHKTGLELRTVGFGFDGSPVYVDRYYDQKGRLQKESLPYFPGEVIYYTQYEYDNIGRPEKTIYPDNTFTTVSYNGNTIATTNYLQQTTKQTYNAAGWLVESEDANGGKVNYDYFSDGNLKSAWIVNQPQTTVDIQYNSRRQRSVLQDPNYGTATYKYNPFGELVEQVSPKNEISSFTYDVLGRMLTQTEPEGTTQWIYDETPGRIGTLQSVHKNLHQTSYAYDDLLRLTSSVETIEGNDYQTSYTYDVFGRVNTTIHPSGFAVKNVYNQYGYLTQIRSAQNNPLLWQTDEVNAVGMITGFRTGNALLTSREFEPETQRPTGIYTGKTGQNPVQNFVYQWYETGNLKQRHNAIHSLWEFFTYDDLNRLETIRLNGTIRGEHQYDPNGLGNLIYKKADGQILFSNAAYGENDAGPHALTSAETSAGIFPPEQQVMGYNSYDKAVSINEGNKQLQITYGHHRQRIKQQYTEGSNNTGKVWAGACEYITENGQQKTLTYLSGPEGVFALHVKNPNGTENIRYIHKDHLGSWHTITDENGNLLQELSFDAWGNRRSPATWRAFTGTPPAPFFDRGFTGHEHLYAFGLINMNGRLYDPLVSRMLSPDNFIQAPDFSQSFNRYSYCINNPLIYVDPSGEWFVIDDLIAAGVGGLVNIGVNIFNGNLSGMGFWETVGKGAAAFGAGAASGTLALYGPAGWAAGGAITGGTNAWLSGATGFVDIAMGAGVGAFSGVVGGAVGQYAANGLGGVVINGFNITSPVAKGVIGGAIGGAAGGYSGGFAGGLLMTGDMGAAHQAGMSGMITGAPIGGVAGGVGGYAAAKKADINPWTGRPNNSITIGEGMSSNPEKGWMGVDKISEDLGSRKFEPKKLPAENWYSDGALMKENAIWIEMQMQQKVIIYDRGPVGNNSQYYNMEVGRTMNYNNIYNVRAIYNRTHTIRILIIRR
jgi:RHS repeat-associated protein